MKPQVRAGISGWRYPPWRGTFYPSNLSQDSELEFASSHLRTIEINGTFYSLQRPQSFKAWYTSTPKDFVFSVKGPRYLTHIRRLRNFSEPLANFFGSGVLHLRDKLGPLLWQLPPNFIYNPEVLENFFRGLPRNFRDAARLAKHGNRVDPDFPKSLPQRKLRHVIEVRHSSFENPEFIDLLRRNRIGLVQADTAGRFPYMEDLTGDVIYLRLHGDEELYVSGYDKASIRFWAKRIGALAKGGPAKPDFRLNEKSSLRKSRPVFVYFDNDVKVRAPFDAQELQKYF